MQKWSLNYHKIVKMGPRQKVTQKATNGTQICKKDTKRHFPLVFKLNAMSPRAISSFHGFPGTKCPCSFTVDWRTKFAIESLPFYTLYTIKYDRCITLFHTFQYPAKIWCWFATVGNKQQSKQAGQTGTQHDDSTVVFHVGLLDGRILQCVAEQSLWFLACWGRGMNLKKSWRSSWGWWGRRISSWRSSKSFLF